MSLYLVLILLKKLRLFVVYLYCLLCFEFTSSLQTFFNNCVFIFSKRYQVLCDFALTKEPLMLTLHKLSVKTWNLGKHAAKKVLSFLEISFI